MKLNFWQYLGVFIFVIALCVILKREFGGPEKLPAPAAPPATQPAP